MNKNHRRITNKSGSRVALIQRINGKFNVYCGFKGTDCPGEELVPSRHFNGTCSRDYKSEKGATKAALKFTNG